MVVPGCEQECIPVDDDLLGNWMRFKTTRVQGDSTAAWTIDTVMVKTIDTYYCNKFWLRMEFIFNRAGIDSPRVGRFRMDYEIVNDSLYREPPPYSSAIIEKFAYTFTGDTLLFARTYSDTVRYYDYHVGISDAWLNSLLDQIP